MCGIAGIIGSGNAVSRVDKMLSLMDHRGPDGDGIWESPQGKCILGHKRLSIIDLDGSAQPMSSPDGRYHLVYNGEIYNYLELKLDLVKQGWSFQTKGDSEVLLAGLILEGPSFLNSTVGMFAFALWDEHEKSLLLARDRVGIKPLYYSVDDKKGLVFGSELKSVVYGRGQGFSVNPQALDCYLTLRYVPGPMTMVNDVYKFPPGHWGYWKNGELTLHQYWDVSFETDHAAGKPAYSEAVDAVEKLLDDSVRLRLRSDVPYGAFLSGGVDSAVVTAMMTKHSDKPVRTYSIGFEDFDDECAEAKIMAAALETNHTEISLLPEDLYELGNVAWLIDEPFPDPIVLAMHKLSETARKDVKVILTGEGADELFGGYVHHPHMALLDRLSKWVPAPVLKVGGAMAGAMPMMLVDRLFNYPQSPGKKGRARLASLLSSAKDPLGRYLTYVSLFTKEERDNLVSLNGKNGDKPLCLETYNLFQNFFDPRRKKSSSAALWDLEYKYWLVDNILFKQDKSLMGQSIEGRVPFCDHRLVEYASKLPFDYKIRNGVNKRILRSVSEKFLPERAGTTKKKAFMVPLVGRYGEVMVEIATDVFGQNGLAGRGVFNHQALSSLSENLSHSSFLAGKQTMALIMFELWCRAMDRVCRL